jgi:hypothetical protein
MLRIVAALAALSVTPALAQTITDGSGSVVPAGQMNRMMEAIAGYRPYMGPDTQLRGLHIKRQASDNTTLVCGEALVNGAWQTFYFDIARGSTRVGQAGDVMCNM